MSLWRRISNSKWRPVLTQVEEQAAVAASSSCSAAVVASSAVVDSNALQRSPSQDTLGDAFSTVVGDSDLDPAELEEFELNETIHGPGVEHTSRTWQRIRDTEPHSRSERPPSTTEASQAPVGAQELVPRTGNVGWYFGNFGVLTNKRGTDHKSELAVQIRAALKRVPAQIVGLAECDAFMENWLKLADQAVDDTLIDNSDATVVAIGQRTAAEFLTLRGREEPSSVLLGLRASSGPLLELSQWHRKFHGR